MANFGSGLNHATPAQSNVTHPSPHLPRYESIKYPCRRCQHNAHTTSTTSFYSHSSLPYYRVPHAIYILPNSTDSNGHNYIHTSCSGLNIRGFHAHAMRRNISTRDVYLGMITLDPRRVKPIHRRKNCKVDARVIWLGGRDRNSNSTAPYV
jgi:hypothetical protein